MGLMVVYLLTGWLPTLMKDAGLSITVASNVTAMFQIGATLGAVLIGWGMDRTHPSRIIGGVFCRNRFHPATGLCRRGVELARRARLRRRLRRQRGADWGSTRSRPAAIRPSPAPPGSAGCSAWVGSAASSGSLVGGALPGLGWSFGAILGILAIPSLLAAIAIATTRPAANAAGVREAAAH